MKKYYIDSEFLTEDEDAFFFDPIAGLWLCTEKEYLEMKEKLKWEEEEMLRQDKLLEEEYGKPTEKDSIDKYFDKMQNGSLAEKFSGCVLGLIILFVTIILLSIISSIISPSYV